MAHVRVRRSPPPPSRGSVFASAKMGPCFFTVSDLHQLFILTLAQGIDLLIRLINKLLQLFKQRVLYVFITVLLDGIVRRLTMLADGDTRFFGQLVHDLRQIPPALLGHRREDNTEHNTVINRIGPQIRLLERFFHGLHGAFVPRLHNNRTRILHADAGKGFDIHALAIGFGLHMFNQRSIGTSRLQLAELMLEELGGLISFFLEGGEAGIHRVKGTKGNKRYNGAGRTSMDERTDVFAGGGSQERLFVGEVKDTNRQLGIAAETECRLIHHA